MALAARRKAPLGGGERHELASDATGIDVSPEEDPRLRRGPPGKDYADQWTERSVRAAARAVVILLRGVKTLS